MKFLMWICAGLSLGFLALVALNLYDYSFQPELPWREGDLMRALAKTGGGCILFGVAAGLLYRLSK